MQGEKMWFTQTLIQISSLLKAFPNTYVQYAWLIQKNIEVY